MMDTLIIVAAKYLFLLSLILLGWFGWKRLAPARRWEFAWLGGLSAVVTLILMKVGGLLWFDPRPFVVGHFRPLIAHAADNGFPSDHTALTMLIALVVWQYDRRLGYILAGISIIVGLARVLAGVHHLADIMGAMVMALIGMLVGELLVQRLVLPRLTNH